MSPDDPLQNTSDWEPPSAEKLAGQIPGYDVERLIARGGMAAVYLGKQVSLDRPVALKVLPPELGQVPGFNERFASEARLLAKLHDPAIVAVIDFGHTADGSAFIVMELVDGLPLEQWAIGRSFAEKLAVAIRLIQGVAHFQSQGVVHADLKSDNIFVTDGGAVKLLDFGLATPVVGAGEVHAPRFGTPPYTAPEAYADGAKPDPRSDIYSLGITLIQLFGPGSPPDIAPHETFDVARFLGRRDLAAILEPMISPLPENRPVGLDQVVAALRALGQPAVPARPAVAATRPAPIGSSPRPAGTATPPRSVPARANPAAPSWLPWSASLALVVFGVGLARHWKHRAPAATDPPTPATLPSPGVSATSIPSHSADPLATGDSTTSPDDIFRAPAEANPTPKPPTNPVDGASAQASSTTNTSSSSSSQAPPTQRTETSPALTALQEKFLVALAREKDKATNAGDTALAEELTEESRRFSLEKGIPDTDPPALHPLLARLRAIYRDERARLPATPSTNPADDDPAPSRSNHQNPPSTAGRTHHPESTGSGASKPPASPKANMTIWWQCDDRAELLLNGEPVAASAAKTFKSEGEAATIWQAEVAFSEGDTLGFKLRNSQGARHFVAVAKAGVRLLFVSDPKWEALDTDPSVDWWTGKDQSAQPVQRLATRDYHDRWVREFCAFTSVPSGSLTVCWGQNPARTHLRRALTPFDFRTALGSAAR